MLEKKGRITMTKEQQTILNKAKKIFDQVEGYSNEYELKKVRNCKCFKNGQAHNYGQLERKLYK